MSLRVEITCQVVLECPHLGRLHALLQRGRFFHEMQTIKVHIGPPQHRINFVPGPNQLVSRIYLLKLANTDAPTGSVTERVTTGTSSIVRPENEKY